MVRLRLLSLGLAGLICVVLIYMALTNKFSAMSDLFEDTDAVKVEIEEKEKPPPPPRRRIVRRRRRRLNSACRRRISPRRRRRRPSQWPSIRRRLRLWPRCSPASPGWSNRMRATMRVIIRRALWIAVKKGVSRSTAWSMRAAASPAR